MKSILLLATLAFTSFATAADTTSIAPAPGANLYTAGPIPEPSHAMLLMMGVFGLVARRRR